MKKTTISILILFVAITSCSKKRNEGEAGINIKVLNPVKISSEYLNKDTTLIFDLDNISLEGTEAIVHYKYGIIDRLTLNIYGETGQARMHYLFYEDHILVSEKRYQYLKSLLHVKSDKDILPRDSATYTLNYQGKVIEGIRSILRLEFLRRLAKRFLLKSTIEIEKMYQKNWRVTLIKKSWLTPKKELGTLNNWNNNT